MKLKKGLHLSRSFFICNYYYSDYSENKIKREKKEDKKENEKVYFYIL
jgi:hypothetical protein